MEKSTGIGARKCADSGRGGPHAPLAWIRISSQDRSRGRWRTAVREKDLPSIFSRSGRMAADPLPKVGKGRFLGH